MPTNEKPSHQKRVVLQDCCKKSLADIQDVIESGKVMKGVLLGTPFVLLITGGPIDGAYSVGDLDWINFSKAVSSVDTIVKRKCKDISSFHYLKHNDKNLRYFWKNMYNSFK